MRANKRLSMKHYLAGLLLVVMSGCATVPDVTLSYYPVKWSAQVTVTQTIGCKTETDQLYVLNALTVSPTYTSDNAKSPFQLRIKGLEGGFTDSELTMSLTDDGRLKVINQSTTGQGEAIIKSAVGLITAIGGIKALVLEGKVKVDPCKFMTQVSKDKPITLTYRAGIDDTNLSTPPPLFPTQDSAFFYENLKESLPRLRISIARATDNVSGPVYNAPAQASDKVVLLKLQKTRFVEVSVPGSTEKLGPLRITIPEDGTYDLPIPKGAFFGKQIFSLTLSDAGAVTSVGYNKTTGMSGALNALGAVANADTAAAKAAELKAQADLIAQQQRLMLCQTKPDQCK